MAASQKEIEQNLLSSIKEPSHLSEIILEGISSDYFIIYKDAFDFIQKYHSKYTAIPSSKILQSNCSDLALVNEVSDDERKYLIGELVKSDVQRKAIRILNHGADLISQDIYGGLDYLLSKLSQIRKTDAKYCISFTDRDALRRYDEFLERKDKISKGMQLGLRTGFSLFDDNNIGWLPGNLIGIVGRMNIGKSWLLQYTACSSYAAGHRIVYLSPEMTIQEIELRWDTIMSAFYAYQFPNDDLILGKVDENKYNEWLNEISKNARWVTMDSNHGKPFTIQAVESIVEEFQPNLLCVDGFLELRSSESVIDKNWQVMLDVAHGLKAIAQNNKIVILVTSQAKRMNFEEKESLGNMPGLEHVYGGDALGQASDIIITMTDSEKEPNIRYISVPKRRGGGKAYTKRIKLNFDVNVGKIGC